MDDIRSANVMFLGCGSCIYWLMEKCGTELHALPFTYSKYMHAYLKQHYFFYTLH